MSFIAAKLLSQLILFVLLLLPWRRLGVFLGLPIHDYRYYNPYDRTCKRCRQTENEYTTDISNPKLGWWEEMHPGYVGHKCSGPDALERKEPA